MKKASPFASPFERQRAMAASRAAEIICPDDSASNLSWRLVSDGGDPQPEAVFPPAAPAPAASVFPPAKPPPARKVSVEADDEAEVPPSDPKLFMPKEPMSQVPASSSAAPATQAARGLLDSAQQQSERIAQQKARAKKKGHKGVRWGQMAGSNAQNFQLPPFVQQVGAKSDERSVLVIDSRDRRIQSPFQGWLVDEILVNAQSGVNLLSDRQLVRSPNMGYHMNLFYMKMINGYKIILVGSMTSYGTVPCARWDEATGKVMAHKAFQPFRWPMMTDESPTWVDVKVKVEGDLLLHLELRGYRSDQDMTVQMNYLNDMVVANFNETLFVPSCIVTIFQGWRVIATSFEVGGRLYACSDGGRVVALDYPLCHFEFRMTAASSADSIGMDADRIEFRFRSAGDALDLSCSQIVAPATWLVVSRVSGPTLIKNAHWCRQHYARIEGPDQTMQLSQLAGIHAHWTASIEAASEDETGPRVGAVEVGSHASNVHLTCESPLFKAPKVLVPMDALALQAHDVSKEQKTIVLPPVTGGPSVVPADTAAGLLKSLTGPQTPGLTVASKINVEISMTEPGQAPAAHDEAAGSIAVQRRSLEARERESLSSAAVTPQAFLDHVSGAVRDFRDSSSASGPIGQPVSFAPTPRVEEC